MSERDDEDLIGSAEVKRMFGGISDMSLWRWVRSEKVGFPKPVAVISGKNYWMVRDLRAFRERCAVRDDAEAKSIATRLRKGAT